LGALSLCIGTGTRLIPDKNALAHVGYRVEFDRCCMVKRYERMCGDLRGKLST